MLYRTTPSSATSLVASSTRRKVWRGTMALAAASLLALPVGIASAQDVTVKVVETRQVDNERRGSAFELRPMVGAYVPFGTQSDFMAGSNMYGAQLSWAMSPKFAFTGNFGWVRTEDRLTAVRQDIDLFNYDAGVEARLGTSGFSPFIGLGAGARTYDYKDLDVDSRTFGAGYAALGAEIGFKALGIRIEGRDYLSAFRPFSTTGGERQYRNDLTLTAGLNLRVR